MAIALVGSASALALLAIFPWLVPYLIGAFCLLAIVVAIIDAFQNPDSWIWKLLGVCLVLSAIVAVGWLFGLGFRAAG